MAKRARDLLQSEDALRKLAGLEEGECNNSSVPIQDNEGLFNIESIRTLKKEFKSACGIYGSLTKENFKSLLLGIMSPYAAETVYRMIDTNGKGGVSFSEFVDFFVTATAAGGSSGRLSSDSFYFIQRPGSRATSTSLDHRDCIDQICAFARPCRMVVTGGRDGQLLVWKPSSLQLMAKIDHKEKNRVYLEKIHIGLDTMQRALLSKGSSAPNNNRAKFASVARANKLKRVRSNSAFRDQREKCPMTFLDS
jgi:hypothetical protein